MATLPELLDPRDPDPAVRRMLRAWLALQEVGAWRPAEAVAALERAPDPERALRALDPGGGRPTDADLERRVAALARAGVLALPLSSPLYPPRVRRLPDAAPLLCVRGDVTALSAPAVAIVGARAATSVGREVASNLAGDLAALGFVVVSGLARGIDAAAHRGALEAGGLSAAVLACGPDRVYPPEHAELAERIAERGAVVSELPPGALPLRHHFPLRNRLISGLALALVVVEARERSGSLITAAHARDQGVEVLVVPGSVTSPTSRGSNALLRYRPVSPCLDVDDVLKALGLPPPEKVASDPLAGLEGVWERQVLAALLEEPASADELARRLGRDPGLLAADLVNLELTGRIARERDGRLRARRRRR